PEKAGAVLQPLRRTDVDVEPSVVVLGEELFGRTRRRIDGEEREIRLLAIDDEHGERAALRPHDVREIRVPREIVMDPLRLSAADADDAQVDLRVRRARTRVLERYRRALGMARIGDVDGVHRACVGALETDLLAVG